jgi:hypothetical protein
MARHHHNTSHNQPITTIRALPLRILSVLALILPLLLLIISLSLSLAAIYSPQWGRQDLYYANGTVSAFHNLAAPFYNCTQWGVATEDLDVAGPNLTCHRVKGTGSTSFRACERLDPKDAGRCQQSVLAANLMVAGVVFVGVALGLSAVLMVVGYRAAAAAATTTVGGGNVPAGKEGGDDGVEGGPRETGERAEEGGGTRTVSVSWVQVLDAGMLFLATMGSVMLLLAQVVGINVFVNAGFGNVNFQEVSPNTSGLALPVGSWYMGKASYIFVSVAWLAGLLASLISRYV